MVELERSVTMVLEEKLLLGTTVAKDKTEQLREKVEELHKQGIKPKLVMMRVGDKADDLAYQRSALSRMEKVNILSEVQEFPNDVTEEVFLRQLEENNQNDEVHGILIFLPLPKHLDLKKVKECISPDKDIDAISPINIARLMNAEECFVPCTPKAVMELLSYYNIPLQGKHVVVIGRSMVIGKPVSMLLLNENATVTMTHSKTTNLQELTKRADIIVCALGKSKFLTEEYVSPHSIVIDVGINVDETGALTGDADTEQILPIVKAITPVPRGVGSVTTVMLAKQVIESAERGLQQK
ncbi:tetrahydrofolate dehydrogenase/cyclohydrolase, NAD(P)-binding domain protein [Filifactor alocis ATCC 35896]|jgi:5,10-methylene-tetrahydrofolate dehydrogenase/Methenyl tetrahydrofolate cyclohydrolase|uniref:Bifunctional protein FolD n=1 Tax=Filifactor alocis (strain ATCC 35896 / CCUG 47790 / D40 B5) TaxID=546269 RepID=D6GST6_FILAD|nr:tetrahydrofolate dehydrogenase/cyclohydrolase catalytic domain-containing protein [Filifactor alocis]EFE27921.2 tetrahydrofolate dehydrogenase/cyclohydrolase, NAD(P)-binding domain protein [Filifactor alocis ATCC 35896]